jgi:TonB family protein
MNIPHQTLLLTPVALLIFTYVNGVQAIELSKHLATVTEPIPIKIVEAKYPRNAARYSREGWAKLSFIIEKDGSVSNVLVTETSGSKDFAKSAKSALQKWQYQPAFENGEPVQQCINDIHMSFRMQKNGEMGVSRKFKNKYKQAIDAIENKKYTRVEELLEQLFAIKKRHLSESNYLHSLAASYAKITNNDKLQLFHLNRIHLENSNLTPPLQKLATLNDIFELEFSLNKFKDAHSTYLTIIELKVAEPHLPHFNKIMNKIDTLIAGPENIVVDADIDEKSYWQHQLLRNEFSLVEIQGSLNKLDVRCANKRHLYTVKEDNSWKIPKKWKNCSIFVFGENETQFKLVEHPMKS